MNICNNNNNNKMVTNNYRSIRKGKKGVVRVVKKMVMVNRKIKG